MSLHSLAQFAKLFVVLFCAGALGSSACRGRSAEAEQACASLAEGHQALSGRAANIQALVLQIPTQPESIRATQRALADFVNEVQELSLELENLHLELEAECKRPALVDDDYQTVFDSVYAPYIQLSAGLVNATQGAARRLDEPQSALLDPAARALEQAAQQMALRLAEQAQVCRSDFDSARCEGFDEAIAQALRTGTHAPHALDAAASETDAAPVLDQDASP